MSILTVNLAKRMIKANSKVLAKNHALVRHQQRLDKEAAKLVREINAETKQEDMVNAAKALGLNYVNHDSTIAKAALGKWGHLPQDRVFTLEAIKSVCLTYGLRFLPSRMYVGELHEGIPAAMADVQAMFKCTAQAAERWEYFIAAPKEAFKLSSRPAPDPLLFVKIDDNNYLLVHKWGSDISIFRRLSYSWWLLPLLMAGPNLFFSVRFYAAIWNRAWTENQSFGCVMWVFVLTTALAGGGLMISSDRRGEVRRNWNSQYR